MKKLLITGASGLIGTHLTKLCRERGFEVVHLSTSRSMVNGKDKFFWSVEDKYIDERSLDGTEHIIHLAGAPIGSKRWTKKRKKLIINSRVQTAELLFANVQKLGIHLKSFISASATGYYGSINSDKIFSETDPPSRDFTGEVCRKWENAAMQFVSQGTRTAMIRSAVVLSKNGGALQELLKLVHLHIAPVFGSGKQYFSWIHIEDLCEIYFKVLTDENMNGAYNAVSPEFCTNKEFADILGLLSNRKFLIPFIPASLLKLGLGEMADSIILGSRISSEKIQSAGYRFKFISAEAALRECLQ